MRADLVDGTLKIEYLANAPDDWTSDYAVTLGRCREIGGTELSYMIDCERARDEGREQGTNED